MFRLLLFCVLWSLTSLTLAIEKRPYPFSGPEDAALEHIGSPLGALRLYAADYVRENDHRSTEELFAEFTKNIQQAHPQELKFLEDFLNLPLSKEQFEDVLRGAKVILKGDKGHYYNRWNIVDQADGRTCTTGGRISTHPSGHIIQSHFNGPLFKEVLFDASKYEGEVTTWFQLERMPVDLFGQPIGTVVHFGDFIMGKLLHNWNIGPYGSSGYVDHNEIVLDLTPSQHYRPLRELKDNTIRSIRHAQQKRQELFKQLHGQSAHSTTP